MSVASLLNDAQPQNVQLKPAVRRVVSKPQEHEQPAAKVPPVVRPPPVEIKREALRDEDVLTFSIISKILLPKESIERIDLCFKKLLEGKLSFQTVSKTISTITEKCPAVFRSWQLLLDRTLNRTHPLVKKIREVVIWYLNNGLSKVACMNFIKFLSYAKQEDMSRVAIFSAIVGNENDFSTPEKTARLLKFALELLPLLPASARSETPNAFVQEDAFWDIEHPDRPFEMPKKTCDMPTVKRARPPTSITPHNFTPSHNYHPIDVTDDATSFIFNFMTKSTPVGHEGGANSNHYHAEAALPPTRDVHDLLETLETLEHEHDSIMSFTEDTRVLNHAVDRAGKSVYGETAWEKLRENLWDPNVRNLVIRRCRSVLPLIESEHRRASQYASHYLQTQPTNKFLESICPPDMKTKFEFTFDFRETEVAAYLKSVILKNSTAIHKNPHVLWFIEDLLPDVHEWGSDGEKVEVYVPRSFACALWYFQELCECIKHVFDSDTDRVAVAAESWDAVLDSADERVREKFMKTPRKLLSKILKSIISHRTIVDDNADLIMKHLGLLSQHIAHFYPIYSILNHACSSLRNDPHFPHLRKCAHMFGHAKGPDAAARLTARRGIYQKLVHCLSGETLFKIQADTEKRRVTVTKL